MQAEKDMGSNFLEVHSRRGGTFGCMIGTNAAAGLQISTIKGVLGGSIGMAAGGSAWRQDTEKNTHGPSQKMPVDSPASRMPGSPIWDE